MATPDQVGSPFRAAGALPVDRRYGGRIAAMDQLPIHALGNQYVVDGNGTVTSLPSLPIGETVFLQLAGTPTFTNSARLLCPGSVNYTAVAGDLVVARSGGDGAWRLYVLPTLTPQLIAPPQGRLTLQSGIAVMTTTTGAKTALLYTPYQGNQIPIYDGANFNPILFSELSGSTTDTTKNPAAIGASKVNDWFVWNDAGTIRLGHGPDWTSDTARSAGTALVMVNGTLLNSVAITNGPAASRGTFVGTTRSNGSSQLDWIYGGVSSGGTAGFFGVWNAYNRVLGTSFSADSTDSWTYAVSSTWRQANASAGMRATIVRGLDEDSVICTYNSIGNTGSAGSNALTGVGVDSTSAYSGATGLLGATAFAINAEAKYTGLPGIGAHFFQAIEAVDAAVTATFYGDAGKPTFIQSGLHTHFIH